MLGCSGPAIAAWGIRMQTRQESIHACILASWLSACSPGCTPSTTPSPSTTSLTAGCLTGTPYCCAVQLHPVQYSMYSPPCLVTTSRVVQYSPPHLCLALAHQTGHSFSSFVLDCEHPSPSRQRHVSKLCSQPSMGLAVQCTVLLGGPLYCRSADIYEHSTEVLFLGRQDAMQVCCVLLYYCCTAVLLRYCCTTAVLL